MFLTKVCEALNQSKIKYAVVGGFAVALHGAVRGTVDLDIVLALTEQAFLKTETAILKLGLKSRLPVNAQEVFRFRKEYIKNRNLIAWSFFDPLNQANQLDIIITHDVREMDTETIVIGKTKICLVSIKSLIEMKKVSGRPQDIEDVKSLQVLIHDKK